MLISMKQSKFIQHDFPPSARAAGSNGSFFPRINDKKLLPVVRFLDFATHDLMRMNLSELAPPRNPFNAHSIIGFLHGIHNHRLAIDKEPALRAKAEAVRDGASKALRLLHRRARTLEALSGLHTDICLAASAHFCPMVIEVSMAVLVQRKDCAGLEKLRRVVERHACQDGQEGAGLLERITDAQRKLQSVAPEGPKSGSEARGPASSTTTG